MNDRAKRQFANEEEKFDTLGAGNLMSSKHTQSKMNALFLDTRVFNMSSAEYIPELSLPGALDRLNSEEGTSPLDRGKKDKFASFIDIRTKQRVSNDVSQLTLTKPTHRNDLS